MKSLLIIFLSLSVVGLAAQENTNQNKFRQLDNELPTPNTYRSASGAPGHEYWQQRADYDMKITIDDENQKLMGSEKITYYNESPNDLTYMWLQLDQNVRAKDSHSYDIRSSGLSDRMSSGQLNRLTPSFEGGFNLESVTDQNGKALKYTVNKTMMRIELPSTLKPKSSFTFNIKWWYNINNTREIGGRSGYEHFAEDDNNVYVIAQYFPRMCVYDDINGWQNKQFLGRGEFALIFGDYNVEITVPEDHLVAATGELQNADKVLSKDQKKRLKQAKKSHEQTVTIATYDEAEERMQDKKTRTKTWKFKADNVRDFAFATSRRFIWDAMGVPMSDGRTVMAMSMWTKEGDCLWKKYSTKAVAHTVKWYSHYTVDYPYPVAWSIDGSMGMEYPMICFNFGRCEDDGTYSQRTKYGHIGVIIHEVGHNWFPMIINSDERQWTWMDEGLNTFMQYITEQHWERDYPSRRGPANKIVDYMKGDKDKISPIMTNSESIFQFGNNAYGKPATALNILRETIMGRELFDYAFKEYAQRWKFKHPSPADFFRTMEDASAVDLDWFWRGWFYTNDHVDLSLNNVKYYKIDSKEPKEKSKREKAERAKERENISVLRNREQIKQTLNEQDTTIDDLYTNYDPLDSDIIDEQEYQKYLASLSDDEKEMLKGDSHYYELEFENVGGLPMPIILEFAYEDGTTEIKRIPAEIWRFDQSSVTKAFTTKKKVINITLDPFLETADVDTENNSLVPDSQPNRFELFKRSNRRRGGGENPMQRAARAKKLQENQP
ncbi:MAG: M1 family metallopeptidase [Saprospiraceae bacterium]|nr:M1 family metallopeptidase [Saprospiraceae bacterium]